MTDTEQKRIKAICEVAHIDDISDLSDGYHTFGQLYYQRMMLFAALVKQNRDKAWKSLRHEDGELCFGGGWFIVGIDTPEGSYTYHYENKYFDLFDCEILDYAKHWDGHTEKDVIRLLSLEQEACEDCISRQAAQGKIKSICDKYGLSHEDGERKVSTGGSAYALGHAFDDLPPVTPQQKIGRCKGCKYFEYNSKIDGLPLIVAHEICKRWGDGCQTKEDGYCFLYEPQERKVQDTDSDWHTRADIY